MELREVSREDLTVFFEHQHDVEAAALAAFPSRDREAFDAHWLRILADPEAVVRTVVVAGEAAGNVVSWRTEEGREVGYWLGREFWGRGHATEALRQFLALVPERPLFAHVAPHNAGSLRVLEKCGFTPIGEADGLQGLILRGAQASARM